MPKMKSCKALLCIFFALFGQSMSHASSPSEYSIGGAYRLYGQNIFSNDTATLDLGLKFYVSRIAREAHEFGLSTSYDLHWHEFSRTDYLLQRLSFSPCLFYRHHIFVSSDDARFPLSFYFGPNLGGIFFEDIETKAISRVLIGLTIGANIFLAKDFALDFSILEISKSLGPESHVFMGQTVGLKFFL